MHRVAISVQVTFKCSICPATVTEARSKSDDITYGRDDWWVLKPPSGWQNARCPDCLSAITEATEAAIAGRAALMAEDADYAP